MRKTAFLAGMICAATMAFAASNTGMTKGKVQLKSAGPLAFGPEGILFIGDSLGSSVIAVDTGDTKAASAGKVEITGINQKVAALLGASADQITINDVKVNPLSKNVYLSVTRGKGEGAVPVILRADASGKITEFSLDNVASSASALPNPPVAKAGARSDPRLETITQVAYSGGKVIVAGLSNEEFSSNLRTIAFPFEKNVTASSIEIYHGSHGRFETQAPVRTFVPYTIDNEPSIVAAYTCTPLVTIPMSDLKPGKKVEGATIAELGAGNRPIDMIAYKKDNHEFILMANSSRGVMKLKSDHLEKYKNITAQTDITGVPYETIGSLTGVKHLTSLDDSNALILTESDLRSVPLP